jgi:ribosome-associated protein
VRDALQDGFLKIQGLANTGGQAKLMIQDGMVSVNGDTETRRGRKLRGGDVVAVVGSDETLQVQFD